MGLLKRRARSVRKDPKRRHTDGVLPWLQLEGRREDRKYVLVNQNDERAMMEYRCMGYKNDEYDPNGLRFRGGPTSKPGEPLTYRGNVLMSLPMEEYRRIQEYGADGSSGWEMADEIEDQILDVNAGQDAIRGIGIRGRGGKPMLGVLNETEEVERG